MTKLGWKPLYSRRRENILRFVNKCIANRLRRYLFNYFNVRNHDIPRYKTGSSNGPILEKVNLECTKRTFFFTMVQLFLITPFNVT